MIYIILILVSLSFLNLLRLGILLIGSDVYAIKQHRVNQAEAGKYLVRKRPYRPLVTVLVPAHNEELTLRRNLESVAMSTYRNIELIIINDSSTDRTRNIARAFQRRQKDRFKKVKVLNINARGKAHALNAGFKYANGRLCMCLDADSLLDPESIEQAVMFFARDSRLAALAPNIKIIPEGGILNIFQQLEYLIGHQVKKTETLAGVLYIVGGVGSIIRSSVLRAVGGYDTDTMTEDMDLSMKIIRQYGTRYRIAYHPMVITYTESVNSIRDLLKQRFRWRYGVYQVFTKHASLFFAREEKYPKLLTWFYLPLAILTHFLNLTEPLMIGLLLYGLVKYGDASAILYSFIMFIFYSSMHISSATSEYTLRQRLQFMLLVPIAFAGTYILIAVEYITTVRGVVSLRKIHRDRRLGSNLVAWKHVERRGDAVSV